MNWFLWLYFIHLKTLLFSFEFHEEFSNSVTLKQSTADVFCLDHSDTSSHASVNQEILFLLSPALKILNFYKIAECIVVFFRIEWIGRQLQLNWYIGIYTIYIYIYIIFGDFSMTFFFTLIQTTDQPHIHWTLFEYEEKYNRRSVTADCILQ